MNKRAAEIEQDLFSALSEVIKDSGSPAIDVDSELGKLTEKYGYETIAAVIDFDANKGKLAAEIAQVLSCDVSLDDSGMIISSKKPTDKQLITIAGILVKYKRVLDGPTQTIEFKLYG